MMYPKKDLLIYRCFLRGVSLWGKVLLAPSHDRTRSCDSTVWPLCRIGSKSRPRSWGLVLCSWLTLCVNYTLDPVRQLTLCEPMSLDYEGHVNVSASGTAVFMVLFVYYLVDAKSLGRDRVLTFSPCDFLLSFVFVDSRRHNSCSCPRLRLMCYSHPNVCPLQLVV